MNMFDKEKTHDLFIKYVESFKTTAGKNRFFDAVEIEFQKKKDRTAEVYKLTSVDVKEIYEKVKQNYV